MDILVHTTYEAIKSSILDNRLRPGTKLTHQMLAESLGVSRTPVRESLERLLQEGYVRRVLNRGYYVAEMDLQEVSELYQTREALEVYALQRILAAGPTPAALAPVEEVNARYRELCLQNLSRERLMVDREFHLALAALAGNQHLCRVLAGIFDRLILKRRVEGFHDTRGIEPYEDHVKLLAAIKAGQAELAQTTLRHHISSACARLTQYLRQSVGSPAAV
jgi:DNA-binding GntR family transcriptional regulator